MTIKTVLFDLDGTLTDSGPGIMNSVQYTLKKYGMETSDYNQLRVFVGPPLREQFQKYCNISEEESNLAVSYYREYYTEKGIFENRLYEGIPELLAALKKAGITILMATSKPEKYAKIIAEHFHIAQYFDYIGGSLMDGTRVKKADVIEYVLEECKIEERSSAVMVGDRDYDIIGAKECRLQSMGVLYGYGSRTELEDAGVDMIVNSPAEAADLILNKL